MLKTAWYIAPYNVRLHHGKFRIRYLAIKEYTDQIKAEGGTWAETEVLGGKAIVKVKAEETTLTTLNDVFRRIPKDKLDDSLSDLSTAAKTAIKNEILDMGYTLSEIQNRFGSDLGSYTLRDVLKFMATRRRQARYYGNDVPVYDGTIHTPTDIEIVDKAAT